MQTTQLDLTADTIDVRDIIARVEELEAEAQELNQTENFNLWAHTRPDDAEELKTLCAILDELSGNGGDEQWRGDWYPVTLISERTFEDHVREMLEDCGTIPKDLPWFVAIDWETTAQHVQGDYTPVKIDGTTYWYR
jgi:hypothetical protein